MKTLSETLHLRKQPPVYKSLVAGLLMLSATAGQAQSPTAPALNFNVFVKNGAKMVTNETDGPVAIGGDLTLAGNYRFALSNAGTFKVGNLPIGLLVGGKVNFSAGDQNYIHNGYVKIGNDEGARVWYKDNNGANSNLRITSDGYGNKPYLELQATAAALGVSATSNPVIQSGLIDFAAAFTKLQQNATTISAYATNIELTNPNGDRKGTTISSVLTSGMLKVNLKTGTNVLNVTGADLNSVTNGITFNNAPDAGHVLVINVNAPGTFNWSVWNQAGIGIQNSPYIIYNFYNTTSLQIKGSSTIEGTVFAPFADITKIENAGNIEGQVIGLSYYHSGGENHYANFAPTLVPPVSKPTIGDTKAVYTNPAITSVTLSWTKGNGTGRMVIAQKASAPGAPADNQFYTASARFGSGTAIGSGFVVYNGTGSSVTVTNLQANTLYYFTVIEYNASGSAIVYNTDLKLVSSTTTLADSDGDGIADGDDNYPLDASRAFNNYFPAAGFGSLMYEDLWPNKGDYDFNDLVIDYRFNTITNAANNVAEIQYSFLPRAAGAGTKNGFAFQLDGISPDKISSVTGSKMKAGWSALSSNGTEAGHPAHANIIVFDDAFKTFNAPAGTTLINTNLSLEKYSADTIKMTVRFVADAVSFSSLSSLKFNPYLIVDQKRGKEVHLADRMPSAKADASYFGTVADSSNPATGRYYKTADNLPWALDISGSIPYPQERVDFGTAYPNFVKWATSSGTTHTDWYLNNNGNRVDAKLYNK